MVVVAVVAAQTTSSSTSTTTVTTASAGGSSGVPVWVVLLIGALGAVAAAVATIIGVLWRRDRATAGAKIESDQQALIERLLYKVDVLQSKNAELRTEVEGLGLGQNEAQARLIRAQDERIEVLQQQVVWQDGRITALREETASLLDLVQKPDANMAKILGRYREMVSGLTNDISKLTEDNRHQQVCLLTLQREAQARQRRATAYGLREAQASGAADATSRDAS
jgi:hypothetical protein